VLLPVREAIEQQEIENLVLPSGWRREKRTPTKCSKIDLFETAFRHDTLLPPMQSLIQKKA
jgi:hypothetical protein